MTGAYEGEEFLIGRNGFPIATPLLSGAGVGRVHHIVCEPFLVFTANAFAMWGLRGMSFLSEILLKIDVIYTAPRSRSQSSWSSSASRSSRA